MEGNGSYRRGFIKMEFLLVFLTGYELFSYVDIKDHGRALTGTLSEEQKMESEISSLKPQSPPASRLPTKQMIA